MPLKIIFHITYIIWATLSFCVAALMFYKQPAIYWLAVFVAALAPLVNMLFCYDSAISMHHKVKLPRVSLIVMLSLAVILLTVPERGLALWLMLGCVGGFMLDTYWAKHD